MTYSMVLLLALVDSLRMKIRRCQKEGVTLSPLDTLILGEYTLTNQTLNVYVM